MNTATNNAVEVANTIIAQLGGNRFRVMTGAKQFVASRGGLAFKLPARFAKDGINQVLVVLDASDTYTITFFKTRGLSCQIIASVSGVHVDSLRAIFTANTGLDTSL